MKQSWNEMWRDKIVSECIIVLDTALFNKMSRKINFSSYSWDTFKAALEEICLLDHPIFKRQWEVFRA